MLEKSHLHKLRPVDAKTVMANGYATIKVRENSMTHKVMEKSIFFETSNKIQNYSKHDNHIS